MEHQWGGEAEKEFERGTRALAAGSAVEAMTHLEKALKLKDNPSWYSYLGYCMARERGQYKKGIELCLGSMQLEPEEPAHYLNLGQIYLAAGNKPEALRVFREGMAKGGNDALRRQLAEIGTRKPPVIASLPRKNALNRFLGMVLSRLGLR